MEVIKMAIRDFMGIDVPAFKRFYKDSKKKTMCR